MQSIASKMAFTFDSLIQSQGNAMYQHYIRSSELIIIIISDPFNHVAVNAGELIERHQMQQLCIHVNASRSQPIYMQLRFSHRMYRISLIVSIVYFSWHVVNSLIFFLQIFHKLNVYWFAIQCKWQRHVIPIKSKSIE